MKGVLLPVLCVIAVAQAAVLVNENGCPIDYTIEQTLRHPNCSLFYQCVHGNLVERPCSAGLHYNDELKVCDFPASAKCTDEINLDAAKILSLAEDSVISGHDDPSQAPEICAATDSSGVLVAHEYCNYFYKCAFGVPVAMKCPVDLLYDPSLEACEWPNKVDCGNRVIGEIEEVDDGQSEEENIVNDDPNQAAALCAAEGSDHSYVAHEICNKFYQCWAGKPVALPCPPNTLWNPEKRYCDFPSNVDCGSRIIVEPEDEEDDVISDNNSDEDDTPNGNNHDDPSQASAICATPDSSGVLVAHENCNQFYMCTFGAPVALVCPSGLLFDPTRDRCEWSNVVNCGDRIIPEKGEESEGEDVTEGGNNGAVNDDPSQAPALCAVEGSDNSYVAHENCDKFYQCWAGEPVPLPCPVNTLWNPNKNYCDFPQNVDCGDRLVPADLQ